jgi:hypothetical protein
MYGWSNISHINRTVVPILTDLSSGWVDAPTFGELADFNPATYGYVWTNIYSGAYWFSSGLWQGNFTRFVEPPNTHIVSVRFNYTISYTNLEEGSNLAIYSKYNNLNTTGLLSTALLGSSGVYSSSVAVPPSPVYSYWNKTLLDNLSISFGSVVINSVVNTGFLYFRDCNLEVEYASDVAIGTGSVSTYIPYSSFTEGYHNVTIRKLGTNLSMYVDNSMVATKTVLNEKPFANSNLTYFCGSPSSTGVPFVGLVSIRNLDTGSEILRYELGTGSDGGVIQGANYLTDKTGSGYTGLVVQGTNPAGVSVSVGGLSSSAVYMLPGASTNISTVLLQPNLTLFENSSRPGNGTKSDTGQDLPIYDLMVRAAGSLGWTTDVTYGVFILMSGILVGFAAMIAIGTIIGFPIGFGLIVGAGASMGLIPWIIGLFMIFVTIFVVYVWRHT